MIKDLIRVKQAAKLMGYSTSHICALAREGKLTRHYGGKRSYLLSRSEVLLYPYKRVIPAIR